MLAMDPPGSSQWMEPVEPELEAAMLNHYAGRAGPGGGLTRAPAPCPLGPGADVASVAAGANASIRRSPSSSWARARRRAAAWAAAAVTKPVRCEPSTNADQVPLVAASLHTSRLPTRPRSAAKCRSDVRHQQQQLAGAGIGRAFGMLD